MQYLWTKTRHRNYKTIIEEKNIFSYKKKLEKNVLLWVVEISTYLRQKSSFVENNFKFEKKNNTSLDMNA